ncbi:uncharacterized protein LOC119724977 [Patiria miniata]|uniref:Reverse transcriptase n=1 Tax=Patiria miniata TaxID=46514 RepID=A0A913ZKF4_PATMI|nr:uncharacterized protein LOC119724977 [Patiria miniata]XP_038052273.1 uncharacterized protein LOC119724977 [Patiria miniata]
MPKSGLSSPATLPLRQPLCVLLTVVLAVLLTVLLAGVGLEPKRAIMEKWVEVGKEMGLQGGDLMDFIRERERAAKEERMELRSLKKQEQEILEMRMKVHEAESKPGKEVKPTVTTNTKAKMPKLPSFHDDKDDLDSYLQRFERYATSQKWPPETWAINLCALLTGKALYVSTRIPKDLVNDYDTLKKALFKQYNLTEDGFRVKFRTAKPDKEESPTQFAVRLENDFDRWIDLAKIAGTYTGLKSLILREQFISSCSPELSIFLKERLPTDLDKMAKLAEQFIEARGTTFGQFTHHIKKQPTTTSFRKPESSKPSTAQSRSTTFVPMQERICFVCKKKGHLAKDCRFRGTPMRASSMLVDDGNNSGHPRVSQSDGAGGSHGESTNKHDCNCSDCPRGRETVAFMVSHKLPSLSDCCREDDHVTLRCGHQLPIMSAACRERLTGMPVKEGQIGTQKVSVLRDSGCSGVVVRQSLVTDDQLTGEQRACVLIDGTIRKSPVAKISIDTPFYRGQVEAICMKNPVYDVILGNVLGVRDPRDPDENWSPEKTTGPDLTLAVQTRAQKAADEKPPKSLKVPSCISDVVTAEDLQAAQESDPTLQRCRELAKESELRTGKNGHTSHFVKRKGILYRQFQSPAVDNNNIFFQVVVPSKYRSQVMKLAHESLFGGHLGSQKTCDRVTTNFFWPGIHSSIRRFVKSCDICQRTYPKGKVKKLPLGSHPLIDTPFQRVAVDIVGPIHPATDKGNRFVLTVVDYATRYPEAVPLRNIETPTVAEALVNIFSRVGVPKEILSDQGSQFMSGLMREVSRLLSVKQLTTTPYHPACNGLVERFNGTLKQMLRKMSTERPKDWDRYFGALLFAYREAPQASLGFSPFELLYGRTIRGPMSILRDLWTGETKEEDTRTTYQYVIDLKNRLRETCELAQQSLNKAQIRQKKYYDKRSRDRQFKVGDEVLLLLPTDSNKLLLQWKGPFPVVAKQGNLDYQIDMNGTVKTFHANLLKLYVRRVEAARNEPVEYACVSVIVDGECDEEGDNESLLHSPVLEATESVDDVLIDHELTKQQRQEVRIVLSEYPNVLTDLPGRTTVGEHDIKLTSNDPIRFKPYPLPFAMRDTVDEEVAQMQKLEVIEPSQSPYASPIVLVDKKDGTKRFCIDFRGLNRITVFDAEPLPTPDEIFVSLSHDRYFSKFDLTKGYWQIPMRKEARLATAFLTPNGLFQFCTMPFGLVNAPATFSRIMRRVLKGLKHTDNFIDDILIHTASWDDHVVALRVLLERLQSAQLTAKPSKCVIGAQKLEFLGHVVGQGHLQPQPDKMKHIQEAKRPETKKQLRSFLGLAGYYRRFIPNFAALAVPLTDLTRAKEPNRITWGESQEMAFNTLKTKLSTDPILHLPDCSKPFIIRTDASNTGVGAVLLQERDDTGQTFPVAYASRKLLPRERSYAVIEKECLAVVWGIQKFEPYLYGRQFVLQTDHQSLAYLHRSKLANARIMRWALALQPYRFRVEYIKGSQNVGADYLSRSEVEGE